MKDEKLTEYKNFKGFEFAQIGEFYLADEPFQHSKNKQWLLPTAINLVNEEILNAECSTYLVTIGEKPTENEVIYVGEYTNSLRERWFREHKSANTWVSWHSDNLDDNLNLLLKKLASIEVHDKEWVTTKSNASSCAVIMKSLIDKALSENEKPKVALWLTTAPYLTNPVNGEKINISQSIEKLFLDDKSLKLPLNSKGRSEKTHNTKSVKDLLRTTQTNNTDENIALL